MTSKVSLGMLERIEAEESADARRLRRPPVTAPKMRVIILSRPFLFWGIEKAELRKKLRPSLSKNPKLVAVARKQRYAGLRGKVLRHKG